MLCSSWSDCGSVGDAWAAEWLYVLKNPSGEVVGARDRAFDWPDECLVPVEAIVTPRRLRAIVAPLGGPPSSRRGHDAVPTRSPPTSASGSGRPRSAIPEYWRS